MIFTAESHVTSPLPGFSILKSYITAQHCAFTGLGVNSYNKVIGGFVHGKNFGFKLFIRLATHN